jgi:hypothetical protein
MVDRTDWRLRDQERWLKGSTLSFRDFIPSPGTDHAHCEFCHAKFMITGTPDTLHFGYTTVDRYQWICTTCFRDFREMFQWTVADTA